MKWVDEYGVEIDYTPAVALSVRHAPKGKPIRVGGKTFQPGEFIPDEAWDNVTDAEKAFDKRINSFLTNRTSNNKQPPTSPQHAQSQIITTTESAKKDEHKHESIEKSEHGSGLKSFPKIRNNGMSVDNLERIDRMLAGIPSKAADHLKQTPIVLFPQMIRGGSTGRAMGVTVDGIIHVGERTKTGEKCYDPAGTLAHEMGHALGDILGSGAQSTIIRLFNEEFKGLSPKDQKTMVYYTGGTEPFAEVFAHVCSEKSSLLGREKFANTFSRSIAAMKEMLE